MSSNIQENLIATVLSSLVPVSSDQQKPGKRSNLENRDPLSLPQLTTNFRKFSSRIGIVFELQACVSQIYTWNNPRETVGYGMIYTFVVLHPTLLLALPFVAVLFCLLVPSFLQLHPPPPSNIPLPPDLDSWSTSSGNAKKFGGTAEGKDFLDNMRDIQNVMKDYTEAYDQASRIITDYTNFAKEKESSAVLATCLLSSCLMMLFPVVPLRLLTLLMGWIVICSGHPQFKHIVQQLQAVGQARRERLIREIANTVDSEYIDPELSPEVRRVVVYEYTAVDGKLFYSGFDSIGLAGKEDEYTTADLETVLAPEGFIFVTGSRWTRELGESAPNFSGLRRITLGRDVVRSIS